MVSISVLFLFNCCQFTRYHLLLIVAVFLTELLGERGLLTLVAVLLTELLGVGIIYILYYDLPVITDGT